MASTTRFGGPFDGPLLEITLKITYQKFLLHCTGTDPDLAATLAVHKIWSQQIPCWFHLGTVWRGILTRWGTVHIQGSQFGGHFGGTLINATI